MPTLVLKLFARQGTGWIDGQSGGYMLGEHNYTYIYLSGVPQCVTKLHCQINTIFTIYFAAKHVIL